MGIGPLYGEDHLNIHDKESFFWLLFWICVHWNGPGQDLSRSEYDSWNLKNTEELAREKAGLIIEEEKFMYDVEKIFTPYCRTLVSCIQDLREVVFPGGKRRRSEDPTLHSKMTNLLAKAREDLDTVN